MSLTKAHNRMIEGSIINVLDYGVDNTGAIDCSTAIQNLINSIPSIGGTIYFPRGTYLISTKLTLKSRLELVGENRNTTIIKAATAGMTMIEYVGVAYLMRLSNLTISGNNLAAKGLALDGVFQANFAHLSLSYISVGECSTYGVELSNMTYVDAHRLYANNGNSALKLDTVLNSGFKDCLFYNGSASTASIVDCANTSFINTQFYNDPAVPATQVVYIEGRATSFLYCGFEPQGAGNVTNAVTLGNGIDISFYKCAFMGTSTSNTNCIELGAVSATRRVKFDTCDFIKPSGSTSILITNHSDTNIVNCIDKVTYDTPVWFDVTVTNSSGNPYYLESHTGEFHSLAPLTDNAISCGSGSKRWSVVYAGSATISTSDENQKQDIANLDSSEQAVASRLKGLIKKFKFKDAAEAKGDDARIHVGVIAQDVKAAFEAEGLDAHHYGVFCSDTWTDDDGVEQTRLGVRYEELYGFIISTL